MPATVAVATSDPSASRISTSERSFIRRKKTLRALMVTVSPGRTTPENSAVTSVKTVRTRFTLSTPRSRATMEMPRATTPVCAMPRSAGPRA